MSKLEAILQKHTSLYLIDFSWHLYRNYHTFINFNISIDGMSQPTGHFYGLVKTMQYILKDDPATCIIICQDGIPVERNRIMSEEGIEYKEGRPEREYNFYQDTNKIKAILCSIPNVYWAYNEDKESDDQMYALAKQAENCITFAGNIYIYSGDNDLLQAIDDRISVIRTREKKQFKLITNWELIHDEQFTRKFHGVGSDHIVDFRVIVGDPSDHISGIPRFPRDVAKSIATDPEWKPQTDKEIKWHQIYLDNQEIINRNYKLMKLSSDYEVNLSKPVVNKEALRQLLRSLQLNSCIKWMEEEGIL